jgi:hypothetical protein
MLHVEMEPLLSAEAVPLETMPSLADLAQQAQIKE